MKEVDECNMNNKLIILLCSMLVLLFTPQITYASDAREGTFNDSAYRDNLERWCNENIKRDDSLASFTVKLDFKIRKDIKEYGLDYAEEIKKDWGTYILFDFLFNPKSILNEIISNGHISPDLSLKHIYNNTNDNFKIDPNKITEEYIYVPDYTSDKSIKIHSYYIDNNSDTTVILHSGYREYIRLNSLGEDVKAFNEMKYNIRMMDSRGIGKSEGSYITFGYNESKDLISTIKDELHKKSNQKIIIYGGSMGGATIMSALANQLPKNVIASIENCGFKSINGELNLMIGKLLQALNKVPELNEIFKIEYKDYYLSAINNYYVKPRVNIDIYADLPMKGAENPVIPKLFIHGDADSIVPVQDAKDMYAKAQETAKIYNNLIVVPDAGHGGAFYKQYDRCVTAIKELIGHTNIIH